MRREDVLRYVYENYGTRPEHPWEKYPSNDVLRHAHNGKWYGLIMDISRSKVGLEGDGMVDVLNVKGEPDMIAALAAQKGFAPAYHMNKTHWITIILDDSAVEELVCNLIDISFEMTE